MKKILLPALLLMSLSAMAFGKKSNDHFDSFIFDEHDR